MADVNANIGVNIDTSNALAQLKALQRQISQFHSSISKSSEAAALAQRDLQRNFINSVNSIGAFSAELRTVRTTAESFTDSLEKNKFSMREYFRFAGGATKTFGKLFKSEFDTINKVAEENVKRLQTQYIKMGRDASGAMRAIAIMPNELDMSKMSTQLQMSAQRQAIFNQLIKQGSTNLLNFGKNTQWAGRQLMVGFTLPLASLGAVASRTFMDMETAALKFRKVYGDLFTPTAEREQALADIQALGESFTRYGISVSSTVNLAAEAAAAGFQGLDLQRQVTEATRLQVLGQIDQQKALETTISLQNAFKLSNEDLSDSINFLNAVENQTVVSLDDITTAIPKVAPVIMQLGGNVKDLAFFMTAMKQGGVNASEGANALKSGLAALINPTEKASAMLADMGVNIRDIVERNKGNLRATVIDFAKALDTLDPLTRARAIEQLFGKFQFARLSTLFENVTAGGTQAARVLDLAGYSAAELASTAESELGMTADNAMNKFRKTVEDLKFALVPVGQTFLEAVTPIVEFIGNILEKFNNLPNGVKKAVTLITVALGAIGPVALMTFGLVANGAANLIKGLMILRNGYLRLTGQTQILGEQTQFLTVEQQNALAVASSLDQSHARLIQTFTAETGAVQRLKVAYEQAIAAGSRFAAINPGMMRNPRGYAKGIVSVPGPKGAGDIIPAMLSPGEAVIPADMAKKYGGLINGMIADNIPGFQMGKGFKNATVFLPGSRNIMAGQVGGAPIGDITQYLSAAGSAGMGPLLAVMAREMKAGLVDPRYVGEWASVGDLFAKTAVQALENSGREFITDLDLEEVVVPALKDAAKGITVAGKEIDTALENAINQIRTVGPVGVGSGSTGAIGRTGLPGSYRSARTAAQQFALMQNPEMFRQTSRFSQSRGKELKSFETFNIATKQWEVATMSHITKSVTDSVENLNRQVTPYLGDRSAQIAKAVMKSVSDGAEKGLKQSTKVSSPSKETQRIGGEIGRGAIIGMEAYVDDAKVAGEQIGSSTVSGVRSGGRRRATSPGGPVGPGGIIISGGGGGGGGGITPTGPMYGPENPGRGFLRRNRVRSNIRGFGRRFGAGQFAGVGMATSMGVAAASMAPGPVGDIASRAMPVVFGLQALQMALKLPIPGIKLFAAGIAATVGIIKLVNTLREKERFAIEGLGDVAVLTTEKLKSLGDFFGVSPKKLPFERAQGRSLVGPQTRTRIDQLVEETNFKEVFKKDIEALRGAAGNEAQMVLQSLAVQLKGRGFAEDQIKLIVQALTEQAGRTDVKLDFKSLDLAQNTQAIQQAATVAGQKIANALAFGIKEKFGDSVILTDQAKQQIDTASKSIGGMVQGLIGQFEQGIINSDQLQQQIEGLSTAISKMPQATQVALLSKMMSTLGPEAVAATNAITNQTSKLKAFLAISLGLISANSVLLKELASTDANVRAIAERDIGKIIASYYDTIDKVVSQEGTIGDKLNGGPNGEKSVFQKAIEQLKQQQKELANTNAAYNKLKRAGVDTATAFDIASDPILAAAIATTKVGTKKWEQLLSLIKNVNAELAKGELKKFFETRNAEVDFQRRFAAVVPILQKLGLEADDIKEIMSNPALAEKFIADLRDGSLDAKRLKNYIAQIPELKKIEAILDVKTMEEQFKDVFDQAMEYFDIQSKMAEAEYKTKIVDAEKEVDAAQEAVDGINKEIDNIQKTIDKAQRDIEINFSRPIEALQEEISDLQRTMELQIDRPIEELNKQIDKIQRNIEMQFDRPIAALQEESSDLANDLTLIDKAAEGITAKYDAQEQALQQISNINQEILDQEKSRISIADALTRGDIAAAAQAAQEAKSRAAAAAAERAGGTIQAAREAELAGLRGPVSGLTREQIEQRQFQIGQQIFALEEQRDIIQAQILTKQDQIYAIEQARFPLLEQIRAKEDAIYALEEAREKAVLAIRLDEDKIYGIQVNRLDPAEKELDKKQTALAAVKEELDKRLTAIDLEKSKWELADLALKNAQIEAGKYNTVVSTGVTLVNNLATGWANIAAAAQAAAAAIAAANAAKALPKVPIQKLTEKMYGGKIKRMASGGYVPGIGMTDKIPALLTPGEFVVNKSSAKAFGPLLSSINESKYPSMLKDSMAGPSFAVSNNNPIIAPTSVSNRNAITNSSNVYNYSVGITVGGTNASPDSIAQAVMNEIRYVDSQRIRGQRAR